jgi:hypothetical protein
MKNNINNYYKNITKSQYYNSSNFDISAILFNAKINKTFNKLLNLCIKYDIKLFDIDQINTWYIRPVNDIITLIINKRNIFTIELSENIKNLTKIQHQLNFIETIDNNVNDYKKKIKDFEILFYLFNNIYNDCELKKICNKDDNHNNNNEYIKIQEKYNNILKPLSNYYDKSNNDLNDNNKSNNDLNDNNKSNNDLNDNNSNNNKVNRQLYLLKPKNNKYIAEYSN